MPRRFRAGFWAVAVAGIACLIATPAWAQRRGGASTGGGSFGDRTVPGARQAEIHNPYSSRYVDMLPGGFDRRSAGSAVDGGGGSFGNGPFGGGHGHSHHHGHSHGHGGSFSSPWFIPYAVPTFGYGYPYYDPFAYGYGMGYGGFWLPPAVLPAETLYGPQAMNRFLGVNQPIAPGLDANLPAIAPPAAAPQQGGFGLLAPDNVDQGQRGKVRASNHEARARARRLIAIGDEHFRNQRYADAVQRYRSATYAAPDLADAYFRQALALAAIGRYETAVKVILRGLDIAPDWPRSGFRLDTLYGDNQLAKAAQLEALAKTVAADPNSAELMFLLGVYLYCDGQPDRSSPFFVRARDLGLENRYAGAYLAAIPPAPNAPKPPAVGVEI